MLKLAIAVLAVALAGTAGAAAWRDLRIDASSEAAFKQSLDTFKEELSPERQRVFTAALSDIWLLGTEKAKADQRQFTVNEYYQQLHGLSYEEVVTFTDPTGETAKQRYREATRNAPGSVVGPPVRGPTPGTQAQRADRAHEALDHGDAMSTRNPATSCHGGPCPQPTAPPAPQ
jgi:hypothetical protein